MKFWYAISIILVLLVSACAQKAVEPAPVQQQPAPVEPTPQLPAENTETAAPSAEPKETVNPTIVEIKLLKKGVDPLESIVSAGSAVTWINDGGIDTTITIYKDSKFFLNSPLVKAGEKFEYELKEKGAYTYWGISYGAQGKIIVN